MVERYDGPALDGVGIGHTRWATHGAVTELNAHPHADCGGDVFVVHNGIIENAAELRAELVDAGHRFASDVDSEVAAHLVEAALGSGAGSTADAVRHAVGRMSGSWALAVLRSGERGIVLTSHRSPLVVARSEHGAFAASDMSALAGVCDRVHVLDDGDLVEFTADGLRWTRANGASGAPGTVRGVAAADVSLDEAPDFMAKEIGEQAQIAACLLTRYAPGVPSGRLWRELALPPVAAGAFRRMRDIAERGGDPRQGPGERRGAGDAGSGQRGRRARRRAGHAHGRPEPVRETADVLRALDRRRGPVLALTNAPHSSLGRGAHAVVDLAAGVEVGVAATKTFTAQVLAGTAVLLAGLADAGRVGGAELDRLLALLTEVPAELAAAHGCAAHRAPELAAELLPAPGFLFVARGNAVPYAAEGALKLKELSYRWAESHPAGELKHGPLALVDRGTPVVVVDDGHPKLPGNVAEIAARGARIVRVGGAGSDLPFVPHRDVTPGQAAPWGPLAAVVCLQHLAREVAVGLGRDVDRPRNLAKSVTVE